MLRLASRIWLVELTTLSRLFAGVVFASLALQAVPRSLLLGLYLFAVCTDLLDGYLARRLKAVTYLGRVLDLIGDKSLTIVSLLYAAARGIDIAPLALIATREVITIGVRIIVIDGTQLLPSNRLLGGMMALMLWGNTVFLVLADKDTNLISTANIIYWICSIVSILTLGLRIYSSKHRIKAALTDDP